MSLAPVVDRLSGLDQMMLVTEKPWAPQHIAGLCIVDAGPLLNSVGKVDLKMIKRRLQLRLSRVPALRRIAKPTPLFCGRRVWVDDAEFSIDHHLHTAAVAPPGTETDVLAAIEGPLGSLIDRSRPLWELWLLTGVEGGRLALLLKIHHALADGLAAVALISEFFDAAADAADPAATTWIPAPAPTAQQLLLTNARDRFAAVGRVVGHPIRVGRSAATTFVTAARMLPEVNAAPRTSLNQRLSLERRVAALHLDLESVRSLAHLQGGKTNDVVLDIVAGGVRALLEARGEPVDQLRPIVGVPVTLRGAGDARALGNAVTAFSIPLPIDEPDGSRRLRLITAATRAAKAAQSRVTQANQAGMAVMGWLEAIGLPLMEKQRMVNLMVSNVPGPTSPLYFLGARIEDVMPILPLFGNETLSFVVMSYCGRLNLVFVATRASTADLDRLLGGMKDTWRSLAELPRAA